MGDPGPSLGPDDSAALCNLTCAYSAAGEVDAALECLERAVAKGFTGKDRIEHDADLNAIRGTERFRQVLDRMSPDLR